LSGGVQLQAIVIVIVLSVSLLVVHYSVRSRPISARRPLDVDKGLPLPEVGQASTVFSLTALFGAYLGIYLMLGVPALAGLAFGTVLGLFVIRHWISKHNPPSFEAFLVSMLGRKNGNGDSFATLVSIAQCAYAASELLILKEASQQALGMRADQAMLFAVATGIIGYFYVLFGGYLAVYRTDILQFVLLASLALALGAYLLASGSLAPWNRGIWPRPGYWSLPIAPTDGIGKYIFHFVIGAIMGFGLFGAAPDAWKRVFVVSRLRINTTARFAAFAAVGVAPFLVLVPFAHALRPVPDGPISLQNAFPASPARDPLFIAASLGLIACFLSSFNSALLASVHVRLIQLRTARPVERELSRFHWLMVVMLILIFSLFAILSTFGNPYMLGNLLLGVYAVIAGIQAGTIAHPARLPRNCVLWVSASGILTWFLYLAAVGGLPSIPSTYEVNTVPFGAALFVITALTCWSLSRRRGHENG
jgi:hypothetical protein